MSINQFILPHFVGNEVITSDVQQFANQVSRIKYYFESNDRLIKPLNVMFTWVPKAPTESVACFAKTQTRIQNAETEVNYDTRNKTITHGLVGNDLLELNNGRQPYRITALFHVDALFTSTPKTMKELTPLELENITSLIRHKPFDYASLSKEQYNTIIDVMDLLIESLESNAPLFLFHSGKDTKPSLSIIECIEAVLGLFPVDIANQISFNTHEVLNKSIDMMFNIQGRAKGESSLESMISTGMIFYDLDTLTSSRVIKSKYGQFINEHTPSKILSVIADVERELFDEDIIQQTTSLIKQIESLEFYITKKTNLAIRDQKKLFESYQNDFIGVTKLSKSNENFFHNYIDQLSVSTDTYCLDESGLAKVFSVIHKHNYLLKDTDFVFSVMNLIYSLFMKTSTEKAFFNHVINDNVIKNMFLTNFQNGLKLNKLSYTFNHLKDQRVIEFFLGLLVQTRLDKGLEISEHAYLMTAIKTLLNNKKELTGDMKPVFVMMKAAYGDKIEQLLLDLAVINTAWVTSSADVLFDVLFKNDVTDKHLDITNRQFGQLMNICLGKQNQPLLIFYVKNYIRSVDKKHNIVQLYEYLPDEIRKNYDVAKEIDELLSKKMPELIERYINTTDLAFEASKEKLIETLDNLKKMLKRHNNLGTDTILKIDEQLKVQKDSLKTYTSWAAGIELRKKSLEELNKHIIEYDLFKDKHYSDASLSTRLKNLDDIKLIDEVEDDYQAMFYHQFKLKKRAIWVELIIFVLAILYGFGLFILGRYVTYTVLDLPTELIEINYILYGLMLAPTITFLLRLNVKHPVAKIITIIFDTLVWYIIPLALFFLTFTYLYRL